MTDLHVEERGEGPAVVLVHAGVADRTMWDREFLEWSQRFRVVRYDVRGYGLSPDASGDYHDHRDLVEVMEGRGIERAAVVGASNGGRIALDLAVAEPSRLWALVLVGAGTPGMTPPPSMLQRWDEQERRLEAGDVSGAVDIDLEMWVAGVDRSLEEVDATVVERVRAWSTEIARRELEPAPGGSPQLLEPLPKGRLEDVTAGTLVVVGEHDQPLMHEVATLVRGGIGAAELVEIPAAAHLPNLEAPAAFDEVVLGFLARHAPPP